MKRLFPVICVFSCLISAHSFAGSATWSANPVSGDWNTIANWTPATIPNGLNDVASFATSTITGLTLSSAITVASSVYDANAGGFTVSSAGLTSLTFAGDGIVNTSATPQSFVVGDEVSSGGLISFINSATINGSVNLTVRGQSGLFSSLPAVEFHDNSNAGTGSFVCEPGQTDDDSSGGRISFFDSASAGTGQFTCEGTVIDFSFGGQVWFYNNSTAGDGVFTLNSGNYAGGGAAFFDSATAGHGTFTIYGGRGFGGVSFLDTSDAGDATFILNGSNGAAGGRLTFQDNSTPGNSTIIINSGKKVGGECIISGSHTTGAPSVTMSGNADLSIEPADDINGEVSVSIGSLAGEGYITVIRGTLIIGANNRSTEFDGWIDDGGHTGSLTKVGSGTLTLTGANTYSGATTILDGALKVNNTAGSGTGTGAVKVNGGALSGGGIISGKVTVGTGSGTGGVIAPSQGASNPTTLTLQSQLIFQPNGSYLFRFNTKKATTDQVIASGVTIKSGAQFNFKTVANKKLTVGTVFTTISNTSASPINGTFSNLADGSKVTVGVNRLQVSYSGGDGNDLTLTVVP